MIWCFIYDIHFNIKRNNYIIAFGQKIILPMVIIVHQNYLRVPGVYYGLPVKSIKICLLIEI